VFQKVKNTKCKSDHKLTLKKCLRKHDQEMVRHRKGKFVTILNP